jgi:hypothetical protein
MSASRCGLAKDYRSSTFEKVCDGSPVEISLRFENKHAVHIVYGVGAISAFNAIFEAPS